MGNAGRIHYAIAFALLAGLTAPATAKKPPRELIAPRPITEPEKALVRDALRQIMKDPSSAQFKWRADVYDGSIYCAEFNAKNVLGGYVGFTPYVAVIEAGTVTIRNIATPGRRDGSIYLVRAICGKAGVNMDEVLPFEQ